jgi:hypothetical protein
MAYTLEEALRNLLQQYSISICSEPKRLQAMLQDLTMEHKGKIKALISAIEEGIINELIQYSGEQVDYHFYNRMVTRLHQNAAIDQKISEWAIECWIGALNKNIPDKPQTPPEEEGESSQGTVASPHSSSQTQPGPSSQASTTAYQSGNTTAAVVPIQPKKSKRSSLIRIAIVFFLLIGAYKLFFSHDERSGDTAKIPTNTKTAGSIAENSKTKEESEQTAENRQEESTQEETDLTSAVTEQQVRDFMKRYITLGVASINQRDFSLIEELIDPSGKLYNDQQNYLQYVKEKGITEQLNALDVEKIEVADENHFKVHTYEEYEINYNNESKKFKSFRSEFLLTVFPNHTLRVKELISTEEVNSYDIEEDQHDEYAEENSTDTTNNSEIGSVESAVRLHYASISNDDFETAYNVFSSNRKRKVSMEGWMKGLQHNIKNEINTVKVTKLEGDSATVYIELTSYDDNGDGTILIQNWGGYWQLVKENGRWALDEADIQKLDSRVENNETF